MVIRDPLTREPVAGIKRWVDTDARRARLILFERDQITEYVSGAEVPAGGFPPNTGWTTVNRTPNPLGVLPLVPFTNRARVLGDPVSEIDTVADLADALNKVNADMLVASEFYAKPRRWATGVEIVEDNDGNVVNPYSDSPSRVWTVENEGAKFGQFPQSDLAAFETAADLILRQVAMLSSLPPHSSPAPSRRRPRQTPSGRLRQAWCRRRTSGSGRSPRRGSGWPRWWSPSPGSDA